MRNHVQSCTNIIKHAHPKMIVISQPASYGLAPSFCFGGPVRTPGSEPILQWTCTSRGREVLIFLMVDHIGLCKVSAHQPSTPTFPISGWFRPRFGIPAKDNIPINKAHSLRCQNSVACLSGALGNGYLHWYQELVKQLPYCYHDLWRFRGKARHARPRFRGRGKQWSIMQHLC